MLVSIDGPAIAPGGFEVPRTATSAFDRGDPSHRFRAGASDQMWLRFGKIGKASHSSILGPECGTR